MDAFRRYAANVSVLDKLEQARFYESAKHFSRKSFTIMSLDGLIDNRNIQRTYPILIMSGEKDNELAVRASKQWHKEEPDNKIFIIEKAGHCANMDNPDTFNKVLEKFIKSSV